MVWLGVVVRHCGRRQHWAVLVMVSAWHVLTCHAIDIGGVVKLDGMAGGCCSCRATLAVSDAGKGWWQSMWWAMKKLNMLM